MTTSPRVFDRRTLGRATGVLGLAAAGVAAFAPAARALATTPRIALTSANHASNSTSVKRDVLVAGTYTVDASTTGVRPGRTLTVTTTHVPLSNTDYHDLDIRNTVDLYNKTNVRYFDCYFRGPTTRPAGSLGLATCYRPHGRGHEFWDCTFRPQLPDYRVVGITGYGFKVRRCDLSNLVDAFQVFNNNAGTWTDGVTQLRDAPAGVDIQSSYIHDQAFFVPSGSVPTTDPRWGGGETSADGSHSDGIQWQGCTGLIFKYNNVTGMLATQYTPNYRGGKQTNACMMIAPDVGLIANGDIRFNHFGGGAVEINVADKPLKNRWIANLGVVQSNIFHRGQFFPPTDLNRISSSSLNPRGIQVNLGSGSTINKHTDGSAIVVSSSTMA